MTEEFANNREANTDIIQKSIKENMELAIIYLKGAIQTQGRVGCNTEIECAARVSLIH